VGADGGGVEDQNVQVRVTQRREDRVPTPLACPAVEPPPPGVGVAESLGQVGPRGPRPGDPQDGVEEPSVVLGHPAVLAPLAGQQVFDAVPVGVGDLVPVAHD
jgi:hypothetical protein